MLTVTLRQIALGFAADAAIGPIVAKDCNQSKAGVHMATSGVVRFLPELMSIASLRVPDQGALACKQGT